MADQESSPSALIIAICVVSALMLALSAGAGIWALMPGGAETGAEVVAPIDDGPTKTGPGSANNVDPLPVD